MICVQNVAFLGEPPKATLQEVRLTPDHPPNNATFHPVFNNIP